VTQSWRQILISAALLAAGIALIFLALDFFGG
jgi:hypothetical protein